MTTLDDRLLGEKLQNYCSSSEDENGNSGKYKNISIDFCRLSENDSDEGSRTASASAPTFIPEAELKSNGYTENVETNDLVSFFLI